MNFLPFLLSIAIILQSCYFQTKVIIKEYKKHITVSHMYGLPEFRKVFKIGLSLAGFLQILFIFSLTNFEIIDNSRIFVGQIIFAFAALNMIYLGFVSYYEHEPSHLLASYFYFLGSAIGGFIITISLNFAVIVQIILVSIILMWILFSIYQINKKNRMYAIETSHVLLSYAWILIISLAVLLNL